jgi:anaerobic dimethyl sulfoxide reductase subunit A
MAGLLEQIETSSIDRRKFVGLAATAGVVASLGLTGCDNKVKEVDEGPLPADLEGGKWIPFSCVTIGCGHRCYNRAYVVDGIIVRQGTDDTHPDSEDFPQYRGCLKGRSLRKLVTGAERLKYPMKRKNWQPGGGDKVNGHLRGVDEWERISWDDALTYIADELIRIRDAYGNRAFLGAGHHEIRLTPGSLIGSPVLNALGGCLTTWGEESQGGLPLVSRYMRGHWSTGAADCQDRMALRHAKLIVFWGFNPAWSAGGGDYYHFLNAKRSSGAKVIIVDPFFNPSAQALADQWIPCRPGTDGALLEAIAHEIITNDWQDQDFLDRCCLGFDADHMPEDAATNENFKDYILGAYDNQPKTAEWASSICGTSVEAIRDLAQQMATVKPMALKTGGGPARTYYGNRFGQLFFTVGWMTGNVGVLGAEVTGGAGGATSHLGSPGGAAYVSFGKSGYAYPTNPICTEPRTGGQIPGGNYSPEQEYGLPFSEVYKAIVENEYHLPGPENRVRELDIKCIYRDTLHLPSNQCAGGNWMERAFRKVEFVMTQDMYLANDALYSDIVLPVQTKLESEISVLDMGAPAEFAMVGSRVIEPYFEAKLEPDIYFMLADKLGLGEDVFPRMDVKQGEFKKILGATVVMSDGIEREPLVTATEADFKDLGIEGAEPQQGRIPIKELVERGAYQVERQDGDNLMNIFNKAFVEDPEANPLTTTSGKYEIYCQTLKNYYDRACFNDIDALPKYKPAGNGAEERDVSSEFAFQLVTPHHIRQAHSMFSNVKQVNEVFPNDLLMSKYDADNLGLSKGDWVLATSQEDGKLVRRLNTLPNVMPGVVLLGEGNWRDIDQDSGFDIGGNANTVTPGGVLLGNGYQAYNSVLLKIEKYTGKELQPDYKRSPLVPLAE